MRPDRAGRLILITLLAVASCSVAPRPRDTPQAPTSCPAERITTLHVADHGAPGGTRYAQVFTPQVAHPERLPVLYFLHGYPGGGDNIGHGPTAATLHAQICAGARPFVLVAPDGNSADHSDTEWADAADGRFDVETFVTGPLVAAVEGRHRRPARLRAIAGFSMGGYGAADLALRHPGEYGQFVSITGYFTIDDPSATFGSGPSIWLTLNRRAHEPLQLAATRASAGQRALLIGGLHDSERLDAGQDLAMARQLRRHGAQVQTLDVNGPHSYALVVAVVPALVRFLEVGWTLGASEGP